MCGRLKKPSQVILSNLLMNIGFKKLQSGEFPHLTKFFVALLPVMHTTAEVERLFSLVNVTKTHRINKLKAETVEVLMIIRKNFRNMKEKI